VIPKARQLGVTTLMSIVALDEAIWLPDWQVGIIAHQLDAAREIFRSKVRGTYDRLPDGIKAMFPTVRDSADTLELANGSVVRVALSHRSGTLNRLHVSEFGKICARYPERAREIVTGSIPAAERGDITIESTAEGQEGRFWDLVQIARPDPRPGEWKLHFLPWWIDRAYVADPAHVTITDADRLYFERLELDHGIKLSAAQRAWYVRTQRDQAADMQREYPSTLDEAFAAAIEGAYFERQIAYARRHGMIGRHPPDPLHEVHSFWDLGRNDFTAIWLAQQIGDRMRFLAYYESSGEHISHYVQWVRSWLRERDLKEGDWYLPHDGAREDLYLEHGRDGVMQGLGVRPIYVPRVGNKMEAIEAARTRFASADFDEAGCSLGLQRLRHYRKEWDDVRGVWRDRPRHDDAAHAADAFMTWATGHKPVTAKVVRLPPRHFGPNSWMR